ncbi:hypothetical protein HYQ46_005487 [Verticillium longisporum]|nr:hypothetical protein HYQ44_017800 [Verticillium longisporum]KAG7152780.1 hypothetical protein HYQ46_005487 [Verticillium longisporum]
MTRLATAVGRIETRLSAVEATLGSLGERLAAESANNLARSLNGAANGQVLQPLRSLVTGRFVESFPRTLAELGDMNGRALTVLLEELVLFHKTTLKKRKGPFITLSRFHKRVTTREDQGRLYRHQLTSLSQRFSSIRMKQDG